MKLFRCYNCDGPKGMPGRDFEAAKPQCPECGAQGEPTIVERATIHFDPPSGIRNRGANDAACNPKLRIFGNGPNMMMTGVPEAVTCKACRETQLWKDAAAAGAVTLPEEHDVPVTLHPGDVKVTAGPPEASGIEKTGPCAGC